MDTVLDGADPLVFKNPLHPIPIPAYVFALITILQRREKLTDADMAEAVRNRPEVRYGLRLSLRYPNVSASNLCQYRQFLFEHPESYEAFEKIAKRVDGFTDTHVNGKKKNLPESICLNDRAHMIITSMLEALETLAATHPNWMREIAPAHWYERYNRSYSKFVKEILENGSPEMLVEIGNDMKYVLNLTNQKEDMADLVEIKFLTNVFHENFEISHDGKLEWKLIVCTFCSRNTQKKWS